MFALAAKAPSRHSRSVRSAFVLSTAIVLVVHLLLVEHVSSQLGSRGLGARPGAIAMRIRAIDLPVAAMATPAIAQANPTPRATAHDAPRPLRDATHRRVRAGSTAASAMPAPAPAINERAAVPDSSPALSRFDDAHDDGAALPTYATEFAPSFSQLYELRRGAQRGHAELHWHREATNYQLRLTASLQNGPGDSGAPLLQWSSRGGFDAAGLAPARFTERRARRGMQAANFERRTDTAQATIRYSGPSIEHELPAGAQDRLSWMLQIAAIVQAHGGALARGDAITMFVSGARGDADIWRFDVAGPQEVEIAGASLVTLKLVREPRKLYDTRVEVWLDPANAHLPVRVRLATSRYLDALELVAQPPAGPR